jgi:hypothetical protein
MLETFLNHLLRVVVLPVAVFAGWLSLCVTLPTSRAAAEEPSEAITAYLQAGEFAPALKMAQSVQDRELRDRLLGQIAIAQSDVGARRASISTLHDLQSDVTRSQIIRQMNERPIGARGGAAYADFDTLIDLITSTIAPDTWDAVGGAGAIESYPTGVYVDTSGVMKRLSPARRAPLLDDARRAATEDSGNRDVHRTSGLRKVSLVRLEREVQLRTAFGQSPDESMRMLGGLYRIKHLFVYPETGDIVLAGPAGDWRTDAEGRTVNVETGIPVLQLDDLVAVLRNAMEQDGKLGCAIKPRQENLAAAKAFAEAWHGKALKRNQRAEWVSQLRDALGKQDIEVWGIDARTRAARVLVEADYHLKLIGMGLEPGTLGVESYLDAVKRTSPDAPPAMNVLRWWFTLNYEGVRTNGDRNAFQLDGPGVRVLSENELLTEKGERIHTGKSNMLNAEFAHSFTRQFDVLAAKYPVYAELRNVFDLALIAGIIRSEDLPSRVGWHMTHFGDAGAYQLTLGPAPREVESIVNAVDVSDSQFIVGVSGGVSVDTAPLVAPESIKVDDYGLMDAARASAAPAATQLPRSAWWWD